MKFLVFITLSPLSLFAFSAQDTIVLISGSKSEKANEYIQKLKDKSLDVSVLDIQDLPINSEFFDDIPKNNKQIIIVGRSAFEYYLKNQLNMPALVVYVKRSTYYHLIKAFQHKMLISQSNDYLSNLSIIYSEPSIDKQMSLIKEYYSYSAVTVMLSPLNYFMENEIINSAKKLRLKPYILKLEKEVDINRALNTLPDKYALLAFPDHYLFNRHSLKNIIISTYRSGRPVFGFSENMVKAGAVASYYSDSEDIATQSIEIISGPKEKTETYSKYTKLKVNHAVARSLNLISSSRVSNKL